MTRFIDMGAYMFEFTYPTEYPFVPPKVTYLTNDGKTRFNPNLYRNGKGMYFFIKYMER